MKQKKIPVIICVFIIIATTFLVYLYNNHLEGRKNTITFTGKNENWYAEAVVNLEKEPNQNMFYTDFRIKYKQSFIPAYHLKARFVYNGTEISVIERDEPYNGGRMSNKNAIHTATGTNDIAEYLYPIEVYISLDNSPEECVVLEKETE